MNQNNKVSLIDYCIPCKARCCKTGKLIGSPILSNKEAGRIGKNNLKKVKFPKGEYWVIKEQQSTNRCFFLNKQNKCKLQNLKPLDCLCYPIKAVYEKDLIRFITDSDCPASSFLNKEFIRESKKIAIKSIKRFDRETYQHWLDNYVGWVRKTIKLNKV
ncbi:MAG: hypothetical protein PHG05_03120 [Candidatus Nanoarchaeia archaeon]|nr:hypothetical protein [Candidatus Nanoarchaeia archaeon]